ncbi:hypothetical protein CVT26_003475 [Gymnopilus dilepis]|uniref:Ubiquitin-like protease family profile domain-containing protein n=1 Tax=Gymnopilus dilepis TaxID=231916 RepID=A0A409X145_9AGAR|nr:hypothetical protein CVT26_003475 [Gymnopilus dilepis]
MLKQDRSIEEKKRLQSEADNLCRWIGRELLAVEIALRLSSNAPLFVHLTRHRDHLLHLKSSWVNPLVSMERLDFQHANGVKVASDLFGKQAAVGRGELYSLNVNLDSEFLDENDIDGNSQELDSMDFLMSDVLMSIEESEYPTLLENTHATENRHMMDLVWIKPTGIVEDYLDVTALELPMPSGIQPSSQASAYQCHGFHLQDLQRLRQAGMLLNDICLNGCARTLKSILDSDPIHGLSSRSCALFTTYDLIRARYTAKDPDLWRIISPTEYWNKDVWILPIHRPQQSHWVLCVAYPEHQTVLLYDSLVGQEAWMNDLEDISTLFTRLVQLANQYGHQVRTSTHGWIAQPAHFCFCANLLLNHGIEKTTPIQFNGHDCGLWVIAWIMSTLRGFATFNNCLTEATMPCWRKFLAALMANHLSY